MREDTADCVGPGWRAEVQKLIDYCKEHKLDILQIKEKFGTLRFYYKPYDEKFNKLVSDAEHKTAHLCEWCGAPGIRRPLAWVKTLCDKHEAAFDRGENWWSENA